MYREKVRTFGISLLGGNSGFAGKYELGIDSIRVVNEEDVTGPTCTSFPPQSVMSLTSVQVVENETSRDIAFSV
jgi:hypothetical protein